NRMESAAVREIDSSTALPEPPPPRRPRIYFATALALLISFFILWFQIPGLFSGLLERIGGSRSVSWFLRGELRQFIALALRVGALVFLERRPLSSVGLKKPTLSDLGLGIALFTAVVLSMQVCGLLLAWIFPDGMAEVGLKGRTSLARLPLLALI